VASLIWCRFFAECTQTCAGTSPTQPIVVRVCHTPSLPQEAPAEKGKLMLPHTV
jgi:hypothetical protein